MKLWLKISVICGAVLIIIMSLCVALTISQSERGILDLAIKHAREKHMNLRSSFVQMTEYYLDENDSPAAAYSLIKYCFSQFADSSSVLIADGETICSDIYLHPEEILPVSEWGQKVFVGEADGRDILIVGQKADVKGRNVLVYVVEDLSSIHSEIDLMALKFIFINASCIVLGTILIILLVRRAAKPLNELSETAKLISAGEYGKRAEIRSGDEVGLLAGNFNAMADAVEKHIAELEEISQRQRLFIGGAAHEFKTPLASMIIHSDTLLNASVNEAAATTCSKHINRQCKWLERLTQKLLKLITLRESAELTATPVREVFDAVRESMEETLAERGTPLDVEYSDANLPMDADLMCSAVINLVDNASKASREGQAVMLRSYGRTIEVSDRGKGIPKDEIDRITEPFYMADRSRSRKTGGCGLGMALVKEIAAAHHAELFIDSRQGEGTTVKIIFPDNNTLIF